MILANVSGSEFAPGTKKWPFLLAFVALVAVGLRVAAMRGDLVLDEIWTLLLAVNVESAWEIFVLNHDNNHILNTLVVYGLGFNLPPLVYRIPATLAGCLALWFGYLVGRRSGMTSGALVLFLLGLSHVFILYGTEARGYAYLTCATLAAWWSLDKFLDQPRGRYAAAFALSVVLGFLSQLPFAFAYAGFGIYSVLRLARRPGGWRLAVILHLVPILTCVLVYLTFVQDLIAGGGEKFALDRVVVATLSLAAGGPETGNAAMVAATLAAGIVIVALTNEFLIDRIRGVLYATVIVVAPAGVVLISQYEFVYPRHFLVPMIFCYVAVGNQLARWLAARGLRRTVAAVLLAAFGLANLVPVTRLIVEGRAQYSAAMRWMAEQSSGPNVVVAGDHDFRNSTVAAFHAALNTDTYEVQGKRLVYVTKEHYPPQGTEWYLQHSFAGDQPKPSEWTDPLGNVYELVHEFPAGSISGWNWWLISTVSLRNGNSAKTSTTISLTAGSAACHWRTRCRTIRRSRGFATAWGRKSSRRCSARSSLSAGRRVWSTTNAV
jgi:hypothetical protein